MRIQSNLLPLLAVLSIAPFTVGQLVPHDIQCHFELSNGIYFCNLNDTKIITETVPLRFFNIHLPDQNDSTVTGLDSWSMFPRNIDLQVFHPQLMQQFPNVQFVHLIDSQIKALKTDSFDSCDEMIVLSLARNQLFAIPHRVFQRCTQLRSLDLSSNSLREIDGESFYGLQNLRTLRLNVVTLSNGTLEYLSQLRDLQLTMTNEIESNALRHMTQLEAIDISDNSLSLNVIQDAIDDMGSLSSIALNRNRYLTFNFTFFEQFELLDELQLIGNQLTSIPANSFKKFRSLVVLRLQTNQISTITAESFAGLFNLEILTLNDNRLTQLAPNTFGELINLRTLDLSGNIIPQIDGATFNGLQSLQTLFLNNMQLTHLTSEMFESLQSLQRLQIMNGRISAIAPNTFTASAMGNLRELYLDGNQITRLNSNSFGLLPSLESFLIGHSVWDGGLNEIERNFFQNFPRLLRFGGFANICFSGVVDMSFDGQTEFEQCFANWEASLTTPTTTTETSTTPSGSDNLASAVELWLLLILSVLLTV